MMRGGMHGLNTVQEEKPRNRGRVLVRLIQELKPYTSSFLLVLLLVIITAAGQGAAPVLLGIAVDQYIEGSDPAGLARIMLASAAVYVISALATRTQIFQLAKLGQSLLADLRQKVFNKIQTLSLEYLESSQAGEIMSRLVNDIDMLNTFFSQALSQMISSMFSLVGIAVAMLLLDWRLGLAVMAIVPLLLYATNMFSKLARRAYRRTRETLGDVSSDLEEDISSVKVAQAFNRTDENVRRFSERNAANRDANVNATAITSAFAPAMDILSTIDMAIVAAIGGAFVISGQSTVGVVVAFLQYVQNFFRPIQTVAQQWTTAQSALAAAERVYELLDTEAGVVDPPEPVKLEQINGQVDFENVWFAYGDDEPVLEDVSFSAKPGEMIALVGPTGAGKTTIASLITRFYDPMKGVVRLDGVDLRDFDQRWLRSHEGLVSQEPFLFSGTIMENIRYGRLDATDDEVMEAAKTAEAHNFIMKLSGGYNTEIGERGKLLSQGQRQLIAIARAILANPRILILDEATASIDTQTEVIIQKGLAKLLKGRTSFVIAHRLSTIRKADQVLVIDEGDIVESGTHETLLKRNGLYADLYRRQFYTPVDKALAA